MLLYDCDRRGRACGVAVPELEEALETRARAGAAVRR